MHVMENGLVVIAAPAPNAEDLVAINVSILAGASYEDEYLGTGISHLIEHMLFKGTSTRAPGEIENEVRSYGGMINGSVSADLTQLELIVPRASLAQALDLLKDMLLNAAFDPAELEKEKAVILAEMRLTNDDPERRLYRLLHETAYLYHPYKHPLIGYAEPFTALSRDDLIAYYERMYVPNRITIALAGSGTAADLTHAVTTAFTGFRRSDYVARGVAPAEPPQIAGRQRDDYMPLTLAYVGMAFHSTRLLDNDLFALDVLAILLGRGESSRLTAALVKDQKLAYTVSCVNNTPRDAGLFLITAYLRPEQIDAADAAIMTTIDEIRNGKITETELETAKRTALADYLFSRETIDSRAGDLAVSQALAGDTDFSRRYAMGIQAVTADAVRAVARTYLTATNRSVVRLLPETASAAGAASTGPTPAPAGPVTVTTLPNGIRLVMRRDNRLPTVAVTAALRGGLDGETAATNGITNLTARTMLCGTTHRKEADIRGAIEARGGSLSAFSGFNSFGFSATALRDDTDLVLATIADVLQNASFPAPEYATEKSRIVASVMEEDDTIFDRGLNTLRQELFGASPYALRLQGTARSLAALNSADTAAFHAAHCAPDNLVIAIAGDIDTDRTMRTVTELFGRWKGNAAGIATPAPASLSSVRVRAITMNKEQSLAAIGFITVGARDPDRYALDVLASILSGSSGRLFARIRNEASLAYTLGTFQKTALDTGLFGLYAATAKESLAQAERLMLDAVTDIRTTAVTPAELAAAKRELLTARELAMQTNGFYATTCAIDELYGLGADHFAAYPAALAAVTVEDVRRVAQQYLDPAASAEVAIAPSDASPR